MSVIPPPPPPLDANAPDISGSPWLLPDSPPIEEILPPAVVDDLPEIPTLPEVLDGP